MNVLLVSWRSRNIFTINPLPIFEKNKNWKIFKLVPAGQVFFNLNIYHSFFKMSHKWRYRHWYLPKRNGEKKWKNSWCRQRRNVFEFLKNQNHVFSIKILNKRFFGKIKSQKSLISYFYIFIFWLLPEDFESDWKIGNFKFFLYKI